jgi:hypothetical protein
MRPARVTLIALARKMRDIKCFSIDGQQKCARGSPCHQHGGGAPLGQTPVEPEGTTMVVEAGDGGLLLLMHPVSPRAISKAKSENCMCKVPLLFYCLCPRIMMPTGKRSFINSAFPETT